MKRLYSIFNKFFKSEPKLLGRWQLKKCDSYDTKVNVFYTNRDHCGDSICSTPFKYENFDKKDLKK